MSTRVPVSVIVPIKDEAANLPRCLASVKWADEILVVDSTSTDGSIAIAQQHGAKVVQFELNGTWPKKKNWALENLQFRNEWVFVLDADEVLPPEVGTVFARSNRRRGGFCRVLDQSSFYVHGTLAAACLLSQLEPAPFSARPRPL